MRVAIFVRKQLFNFTSDLLCCNVKFVLRELMQLLNEVFDCVFIFDAKWYLNK